MKFKKLSDNKIKCIISREEMEENGIDVGDFLVNQEKTHEFIRGIMKQACDELNIKPTGLAYSVQMTVTPNGDLSLIITPDFGESLRHALSELKNHLTNFKDGTDDTDIGKALASLVPGSIAKDAVRRGADVSEDVVSNDENESSDSNIKKFQNVPFWCVYNDIDECIAVAKSLQGIEFSEAALYRLEDKYYLRLRTAVDAKKLSKIVLTISEFGNGMFTEPTDGAYIKEHGKLVSADPISELGCL